jgi:hypothetical protein
MIQNITIGAVGVLALVGIGIGLHSIRLTHDQIRNRNRHLAEQVDAALNQGTRLTR